MLYLQPLSVGLPPGGKKWKGEITCGLQEAVYQSKQMAVCFKEKSYRTNRKQTFPFSLESLPRGAAPHLPQGKVLHVASRAGQGFRTGAQAGPLNFHLPYTAAFLSGFF